MQDLFPGHFKLSDREIESLWKDCVFVFDANVLLGLYRYSDQTRSQFLKVLLSIKDRCWLPFQAAEEFFDNRLEVIGKQQDAYEDASKKIDQLEDGFRQIHQHPFISQELMVDLKQTFGKAKEELNRNAEVHAKRLLDDEILGNIGKMFENRIGSKFTDEELKEIYTTGEIRYKHKIPPGYKDDKKLDETQQYRKYGDLIIWKEVLNKAAALEQGIILITDDKKEDWWTRFKGKTISPRPELLKEFKQVSKFNFYMYTSDSFLALSGRFLGSTVSEPAVSEVRASQQSEIEKSSYVETPSRGTVTKRDLILNNRRFMAEIKQNLDDLNSGLKRIEEEERFFNYQISDASMRLKYLDPSTITSSDYRELEDYNQRKVFLQGEKMRLTDELRETEQQYRWLNEEMDFLRNS